MSGNNKRLLKQSLHSPEEVKYVKHEFAYAQNRDPEGV